MIDIFNPYKIIIKNNCDISCVHKLKYDYTKISHNVKIKDSDGVVLYDELVNEESTFEIQSCLGLITVEYYNNDGIFHQETINTINNFEETLEKKEIFEKVKFKMDNPEGTTEEVELATLMIKESAFDKKARRYVENRIRQIITVENQYSEELVSEIYAKFYGMDVIQELDDDEDVSEIMVNAQVYPEFSCKVYYKKTNEPKRLFHKTFRDLNSLMNVLSRSISFSKQELNNVENARVEAIRANGDRVTVVIPDASEGYSLNIRKFANFTPTSENMLKGETLNRDMDILLKNLVKGKVNIGIGGEMGTGKTTFINYLLTHTEPIERKAVIAGVREIDTQGALKDHDIVVLNVDDEKGFSFSNLLRTALRTTADRIIVPESRGDEFKQVYEANVKTKGNFFTAHATTPEAFLEVCVDMYMGDNLGDSALIKNKIAKSIDIIIIMTTINNKIKIKSISEVKKTKSGNFDKLNSLYYWDYGSGNERNLGHKKENSLSDELKRELYISGISEEVLNTL